MRFSDAELVAMFPRVPYARCTTCRERGPATWDVRGFLLCDLCRAPRDGAR